MIDTRVVVDVLALACEVQARELGVGARFDDVDAEIVARQSAAKIEAG